MPDRVVHPSMKAVWAGYFLAFVVLIAAVWAYFQFASDKPRWLPALALVVFLPPLRAHIRRRLVTLRLESDHLTYETGLFSKTRRTLDMAKIQDVTLRQTFGQRLLGVGDVMLETAGEAGGLAIRQIDNPRQIADTIIDGSRRAAAARARGSF
ncbi:MAG TPA: PH domain-containing protein [Bryobacteraceae bacterium]|nr:PH domain-containing protein [Bryobacteraceae bacterium]